MDNLNTIQQALEKVPVSRSKLYDLLKSHELKSVTVGRRRFILDSQIEEFVKQLANTEPGGRIAVGGSGAA